VLPPNSNDGFRRCDRTEQTVPRGAIPSPWAAYRQRPHQNARIEGVTVIEGAGVRRPAKFRSLYTDTRPYTVLLASALTCPEGVYA